MAPPVTPVNLIKYFIDLLKSNISIFKTKNKLLFVIFIYNLLAGFVYYHYYLNKKYKCINTHTHINVVDEDIINICIMKQINDKNAGRYLKNINYFNFFYYFLHVFLDVCFNKSNNLRLMYVIFFFKALLMFRFLNIIILCIECFNNFFEKFDFPSENLLNCIIDNNGYVFYFECDLSTYYYSSRHENFICLNTEYDNLYIFVLHTMVVNFIIIFINIIILVRITCKKMMRCASCTTVRICSNA